MFMIKTVLSIGLNDKDSKVQEIETNDAKNIIIGLVSRMTDGATVYDAQGIYTHENGALVHEHTIRIEMYGTKKKTCKAICAELCKLLNQESIAMERVIINSAFVK